MSVKTSQSGARMLAVVEAVSIGQPIGASALARLLGEDKSAVQRSLMTLAGAGWIVATPERPVRWELSARLFTLAHLPQSSEDLRRRAGPSLADLRDRTGESTFLAVPDLSRFIVVDVVESRQLLRAAPRVGELVPVEGSATGRAMLPFLARDRQTSLLGREPDTGDLERFAEVARQGYAVSVDGVIVGSTNVAAPVIGPAGRAVAALGLTGPTERLDDAKRGAYGEMLREAAARLSSRQAVFGPD